MDLLVTNGLIAVGKTFGTDPAASAALLRHAIDPAHMKDNAHKELSWVARHIRAIAQNDPELAANVYGAAFGHIEDSDDATNMGGSVLLSLRSNRRQDFQGTWFQLSEALPGVLNDNLETGARVLARGMDAYATRAHQHPAMPGEPDRASFSINQHTAAFRQDWSHSWYRGGFRSPNDGPALLAKFDGYLQRLASEADAKAKMERIINALAQEASVPAVLWASLLVAGTTTPKLYADLLFPLAVSAPMMESSDTRYVLGNFISAAYPEWAPELRAGWEKAVLALAGEKAERHKASLAGVLPKALIATPEMQAFLADWTHQAKRDPTFHPYNIPAALDRSIRTRIWNRKVWP